MDAELRSELGALTGGILLRLEIPGANRGKLDHGEEVTFLKRNFSRLHASCTRAGPSFDEVLTIVSGGSYTLFFILKNNVARKLRLRQLDPQGPA